MATRRGRLAWCRGRTERGALLIELALVAPVLLLLVMGIIDFSMLSSEKISLRGGVREATWNAGRAIFGSTQLCPLDIDGPLPSVNTRQTMCLVKERSGLDADDLRVKVRLVNLDVASAPRSSTLRRRRFREPIGVSAIRPSTRRSDRQEFARSEPSYTRAR